ncbi:ATP-dependent Clp protease proteolytic subunit [Taklimakanibacter lacteus]|uniref:ATP-dependent Clp protease proteolytic subunit n=1 Tax=Taklimakanibacter lacteus TaxID=2268456 RepID=UPI000E6654C1
MNTIPADRYLSFYGPIEPPASNALRHQLNDIVNEGSTSVTILFASHGGWGEDGIALFTYLRALPLRISMHAIGAVSSIAIPVFLAVPKQRRFVSENARFLFHQHTWNFGDGAIPDLVVQEASIQLKATAGWQRCVIENETDLAKHGFDLDKLFDQPTLIDAVTAVKVGLAGTKGEPCIARDSMPKVASA